MSMDTTLVIGAIALAPIILAAGFTVIVAAFSCIEKKATHK